MKRAAIALVAAVVTLAPFMLPVASAQLPGQCPQVRQTGRWFSIPAPPFDKGGAELAAHAVDPQNPYAIFASNGTEVWRTGDAGCNWLKVFAGESSLSLPGDLSAYEIEQIVVPGGQGVALRVQEAGSPSVVFSLEDGAPGSWQRGGVGLPPGSDAEFLATVPTNPRALFLGIDEAGGAADLLFYSNDGGATFLLRSDLTKTIPQAGITGVEVDSFDPDRLWAYGTGGLYDSHDGGASFTAHQQLVGEPISAVTSWHQGSGECDVYALGEGVFLSTDCGRNYFGIAGPTDADSAAHGSNQGEAVTAAQDLVFEFDPTYKRFNALGCPTPGCVDVQATRSIPTNYVARTSTTIERYAKPVGPPDFDYGITIPPLQEKADDVLGRSALVPASRRIVLNVGETKTLDYRLLLPKTPVPLDVYFLLDTSNSMTQPLAGIARSVGSIAQSLEDKGIDVKFGIAEYRSYPESLVPRNEEPNFIYRQRGDIGTPLPALAEILESLQPEAGGFYDAHRAALYQAATGEGQDIHPVGAPNDRDVPPGQEAAFRAISDGLRVVIHASDEPFGKSGQDRDDFVNSPSESAPPPDIPSFGEVIDAFNARSIKHIGIAVGNLPRLVPDMRKVSAGTKTRASKPTDCNGDGRPDLVEGDPLVCRVPAAQSDRAALMVPVIVELLEQIQNKVDVGVEVRSGARAVQRVTPDRFDDLVLQTAARLDFSVTYRCTPSTSGKRTRVVIGPQLPESVPQGLRAEAIVVCKGPEVPPAEVLPFVVIPLVPAIPPPPPPNNPVPSSQAQPQAQAQGAAATQEQEEPQLAFVAAAEDQLVEEELYAMSEYDRRRPPPGGIFAVGVVAVSLMYGLGLSLRRRVQEERVRR